MNDGGEPGHYRAFLSYSHKDAVWGAKLHRRLESYRIPKHLAGTETARGIVPARLSPIFRDREELTAAESLSDAVKAALADSDTLIVMCSPHARASKWVAKEIETFRALHPDRPVLAALIDGEPGEAFPEALAIAEPIAADFRKAGDGERLALLKLVAGMTALPLDALVQRDAQRQLRRVTAITGGSVFAVLVMALLLVFALRAQAEAERQRAEAEGLVEYMLTDLRDRLKGVGRLDVMTAVNERAMGYYGGDTPRGQLLKARILHAMGEDDDSRGKLALASRKFDEAFRLTASVAARSPNEPDAIFAHAQSEYWIGFVAYRKNERGRALAKFHAYQALADRLRGQNPKNPEWQREASFAEGNLCTMYLQRPVDAHNALATCKASLDRMKRAIELDPRDDATALGVPNRHGWLAEAYKAVGMHAESLKHRRERKRISDRYLAASPQDARWQESSLLARMTLGRELKNSGNVTEGNRMLREAKYMAQKRVDANPQDTKMRNILAEISNMI